LPRPPGLVAPACPWWPRRRAGYSGPTRFPEQPPALGQHHRAPWWKRGDRGVRRQTDIYSTDRQTDRQIDRQTDIQADSVAMSILNCSPQVPHSK